MTNPTDSQHITLIGLGSIGISFAALYLRHTNSTISVYDPRDDLKEHIQSVLPGYLDTPNTSLSPTDFITTGRLRICTTLSSACSSATIVQEQGPENLAFKSSNWSEVLTHVSESTHLWSSTSGITASRQSADLPPSAQQRLLVVHPFNPPHIMPLIEIVPSPTTSRDEVQFARSFFSALPSAHVPVVVHKELPGFVGNRLAFVLLREAFHLVDEGVISVADLDRVVENSLGPRWAVTGPFRSYNYGGGARGLEGFMRNLGGTIQEVWRDAGQKYLSGTAYDARAKSMGEGMEGGDDWAREVVKRCEEAYGLPTPEQYSERDVMLNRVLAAKKG